MHDPPLTPSAWLRYDLVARTLGRLEGVESVLEIGAGEGALGARLARRYEYVGLEPDPRSWAKARERLEQAGRGTVLRGDISALDPGAVFDLVCAFEVLEHIEDDAAALRAWRERLRPGGRLLLSVPAYERRLGSADRRVGHYRRYEPERLARLLVETGYADADVRMYGFPLGYLLESGRNLLARREAKTGSRAEMTAASGRWLQPSDRLGWATRLGTAPFRLLQRPFSRSRLGTGLVAVATRRE